MNSPPSPERELCFALWRFPIGLLALYVVIAAGACARNEGATQRADSAPSSQLTSTAASNDGDRFIGRWKSIGSANVISISRDGAKYVVRDEAIGATGGGVFICELSGGSLKSGSMIGNVDFMESSGHIIWRGMEMARLP